MNILNGLIADARNALCNRGNELRIDNIILGKTLYTMKDCGSVFTDMNFCLVLFENAYGFSYFQGEIDYSLSRFVNSNAFETIEEMPVYMQVAVTDAFYCLMNEEKFKDKSIFVGDIRQKAKSRAQMLLRHVPNESRVLLLGAVTEIIEETEVKKCRLRVFDLEKQKVGMELYSTNISDGRKSDLQKEIEDTDYIIATGMIFVSETADQIFEFARENKKNLALYMETGSNFGPQLLEYGADIVLSEFFPYYDFFGETKYLLSQKGNTLP